MVFTTISNIQQRDLAFLSHLSDFYKSRRSPNAVKLACGSSSKSFNLSAFYTPGWT